MFFPILAATAATAGLIQLGSLYVWVQILGLTVKALLAMIAMGIVGIAGYVVWQKYDQRQASPKCLIGSMQ